MIRRGRAGDEAALRALHEASWRDAYAPFVPPEAFGAPLARVMARRWDAWPEDRVIWVWADPAPRGFVALVEEGEGRWLLDNLHVDPARRGGGLGARLLSHALVWAHDAGARHVWLEVLAGNACARRFYARHGGVEGPGLDTALLGHPAAYCSVTWDRGALETIAAKWS
ncbi:MAG: GNAT family N-acetyltransferase [Shimia sp.]